MERLSYEEIGGVSQGMTGNAKSINCAFGQTWLSSTLQGFGTLGSKAGSCIGRDIPVPVCTVPVACAIPIVYCYMLLIINNSKLLLSLSLSDITPQPQPQRPSESIE